MMSRIVHWLKPFTSLKLTIFCLGCAMVLVFLGTIDQVNIGVYEAENRYFRSFFLFFTPPHMDLRIPWFPGGYIVGSLLLVNLVAAHVARFRLSENLLLKSAVTRALDVFCQSGAMAGPGEPGGPPAMPGP